MSFFQTLDMHFLKTPNAVLLQPVQRFDGFQKLSQIMTGLSGIESSGLIENFETVDLKKMDFSKLR